MVLNCFIVDDEPLALELLASYVEKTPFLQLQGRYNSAVLALNEIHQKRPQLLFLDIQMPELSGLELSKMIDSEVKIIFTTAFAQYALEGFRADALDYLLKPFSYAEFLHAAQKGLKWFELLRREQNAPAAPTDSDTLFVKSEYRTVGIPLADILYIEGLKDYVKIYRQSTPQPVLTQLGMKQLEERLPADRFMRVHRSFIVHLDKIRIIERNRIVFGKKYIPVSDSYKAPFQAMIQRNMGFD